MRGHAQLIIGYKLDIFVKFGDFIDIPLAFRTFVLEFTPVFFTI
jgi:hypothetical protein